jgi:RHS repeat-associated protein
VRILGIFIASVLLVTGMNIQPAYAEESVTEAPDIPSTQLKEAPEVTNTQLSSDQSDKTAGIITLTAKTDEDVSKTNDSVSIVDKDNRNIVASCDTGTICTYEYKKQDYAADKTFFARTAKTSSATVQVINDIPSILLSSTLTEVESEDFFYLHLDSKGSLPNGKAVYIVDNTTEEILSTCDSLNCETAYLQLSIADNKTYTSYIADSGATQVSQFQNIVTQSNILKVSHTPWVLTVSVDNPVVDEGSTFSLKANLNQATTDNLSIYFYNISTGKILDEKPESTMGYCLNSNTDKVCQTSFAYATSQQYKAILAQNDSSINGDSIYSDLQNVKAVSNILTIKQLPWSATLHTDAVWAHTDHAYVADINQRTTYYYSAFVNPTTNEIYEICWYSDVCTTNPDWLLDGTVAQQGLKFVVGRWSKQTTGSPDITHNPGGTMYDIQKEVIWKFAGSSSTPAQQYNGGTDQVGGPNKSEKCANTCIGDPINLVTGEFWLEQTDLEIGSSTPIPFTRYYNISKNSTKGSMGYGWNNQYDFALKPVGATSLFSATTISVAQENGSASTFIKNSSGIWTSGIKTQASLAQTSTGFSFVRGKNLTFNFNQSGQLTEIIDSNGNKTTVTYASGKISKVTNSKGQSLTFTWNTSNLITSIKTSGGRIVKYAYSTGGDLKTVTYADSKTRKYNYVSHAITSMIDQNGGVTTNEYDDQKRVITQTDANNGTLNIEYKKGQTIATHQNGAAEHHYFNDLGQVYRIEKERGDGSSYNEYYDFDGANNLISTTYQDGGTIQKTYDVNGNVTQLKDRAGNITTSTYDSTNHMLSETNPDNKTQTYTYDAKGNLVEQKDFTGNITKYEVNTDGTVNKMTSADQVTTVYMYNTSGLPVTLTDANGSIFTRTYTAEGELKTSKDADSNLTTYAYDAVGNITSITYPNNYSEAFTYDGNGNILTKTDRKGNVTTIEYDSLNRPISQTDPNGNVTSMQYDGVGNVIHTTDSENNVVTYEYDNLNQVVSSTDERNNISTYEYDTVGNLIVSTDADNNATHYNYDANNNLIRTISPTKIRTETTYDALNRITTSIDSQRQKTTYAYDANSNILTTTHPGNTVESSSYNNVNQRTSYTDEEGKQKSWTYTPTGQLATSTDIDNKLTKYAYTAAGNLQTVTRPDSSIIKYEYLAGKVSAKKYSDSTVDYAYDANENIETETTNGATTTYVYDANGNILSRGSNTNNQLDYTYTTRNQVSTIQYPSGELATYSYDEAGNMKSVETPQTGKFEYTYNSNNQVTELEYPNGVNQTYDYDANDQQTHSVIGNIWDKTSSYDPNSGLLTSNSTTIQEPTQQTVDNQYTYDTKARLSEVSSSEATSGAYGYSNSGNITSNLDNAQSYNQSNQLTSANGKTFSYDQRGNRTQATSATGQAEQNTYNQANKLTAATIGTTTVNYQYDANGLVSQRKTSSIAKNFVWDYTSSIQKLLDDSDYEYVYGISAAPLAQTKHSNQATTYLYADSLGSVVIAADSNGTQKAAYNYDSYGKLESSGTTEVSHATTRFGYAGEWADPTTGLYNLRARWYDSNTANFLSNDPLEQVTNESYSYAGNNPFLYQDPRGLAKEYSSKSGKVDGMGSSTITLYDKVINSLMYSYKYEWVIGSTKDFTSEEAMREFQQRPGEVFPFEVDKCTTLSEGNECRLHALSEVTPWKLSSVAVSFFARGDGDVVVSATCNSVTFTVSKNGYFDPPGSQIKFSTREENGHVILTQETMVFPVWPLAAPAVNYGGQAKNTWRDQANNLEKVMKNR